MSNKNLVASFGSINLTVTPERMYQAASNIESKIEESKKLFKEMLDTVNQTSSYWEGNVATQDRNNFQKENENFNSLVSNLGNYVSELRTITAIYETTESQNTMVSESLPTDILE